MADWKDNLYRYLVGSFKDPIKLATGKTVQQLTEEAPQFYPGDLDKAQHSYASQLMAERWGPMPAFLGGLGWETVLAAFSPEGFSPSDIAANVRGIRQADLGPSPIMWKTGIQK